jgi:hypothetical protein
LILDSTHTNKAHKQLIADLVGNQFSLLQSIKMGGIGSNRMMIENVGPNMKQYVNKVSAINYANIEMRPSGILLFINKGLQTFTWIIPYYQLVIFKVDGISIHAQGRFIHFRNNTSFQENKSFFDKVLEVKVKFDQYYEFQNL